MAVLEIKNLKRVFGGLTAVDDFSLNIEEGQVVGLIGPNGAGKTTVFNVVCGFYQPSGGAIVFQDRSIVGFASACRDGARSGAHLPEHPALGQSFRP